MSAGAWDVAVLGAGPAGSAAALALARRGVERVCVLDAGRAPGAAAISETLSPDARVLLDRLGLWREFLAEGHEVCRGSGAAWGGPQLGYHDFGPSPHGGGWHLDRARFDAFLRAEAAARGAVLLYGARATGIAGGAELASGDASVRLAVAGEDGGACELEARFVIDATGQRAAFARRAGAQPLLHDRLMFLHGFFDAAGAASASRLPLLEAAEHGWWHLMPLPGQRVAVAFATDPEIVEAGSLATEARWLTCLLETRHVAARLEGCRLLPDRLAVRVAPSFVLDRAAGPRWLAAGDAAAAYDPLVAQGVYQALAGGLEAGDRIADALAVGRTLDADLAAAGRARFDRYLVHRNYYYGLERRWPDSAFWHRRQARTELAAAA